MRVRLQFLFPAVVLTVLLAGHADCVADADAASSEGARLYVIRCASCHGANGEGSAIAPALVGKPAVDVHFMLDTGRMPAAAPDFNEIHRRPAFTPRQIDELTAYVSSLSQRLGVPVDTALPVVAGGDAVRGAQLFDEHCEECHGAAGEGAAVGSDDVAPSLMNASTFQVAEAVRTGPGVMPRFDERALTDAQVDDVARYVRYLQVRDPNMDAGGISLAHLGPVAEGLVGWLFGLGLLVLLVRLIGTNE